MFFDNVNELFRVIIIGTLAYACLIILLRVSGNRTLSKMNSFDLVVTVAFGSTLSTILVNKDVSLAEGTLALALLVGLQFIITWLSVRSRAISKLVKTQPTLLVKNGEFRHGALKTVRVTEDEIRTAVRQNGIGAMELVAAVILESDGSLSVIGGDQKGTLSALSGVAGAE